MSFFRSDPSEILRTCSHCSNQFSGYSNVCPGCGTFVPHDANDRNSYSPPPKSQFNCPHCNAAIEAESTKAGLAGDCPACGQPIIVPARPAKRASPKSVTVRAALPSLTRWTKPKHDLSCRITAITQRLDEAHAHQEEYPCYQCKTWVKPFFDYEQVSSGGIAMTNQYGMTLYRPNTSTEERVRCRNCGKYLDASGAAMAYQYSSLLQNAQKFLLNLQRQESRWHELNQLAKTRPYLAAFLRVCAFLSRALLAPSPMKSVGGAALLSIFLWPFGCLYSSSGSFFWGLISSIVLACIAFNQNDPENYIWVLIPIYIITIYSSINAASKFNRQLIGQ